MKSEYIVSLVLTTRCNRDCPDCCCGIPQIKGQKDTPLVDILKAGEYLNGIKRLHLTGGEPTLYKDLEEVVPYLKDAFQCELLTIETNLARYKRLLTLADYFDEIYVSHYTEESYKGAITNTLEVQDLVGTFMGIVHAPEIIVGEITHQPFMHLGISEPCHRSLYKNLSLYKNKLYPCCVAWGVDEESGIKLDAEWEPKIEKANLPCGMCRFAGDN